MSKFLKLIADAYQNLNEDVSTPTMPGYGSTNIIDNIKKAIDAGSKSAGTLDVQNIITSLFGIDKIPDNSDLQKAIEKIKRNPTNPDLNPNELEAISGIVQDEKTGKFKTTTSPNQNPPPQQKPTQTPTTVQTSYNYNPATKK